VVICAKAAKPIEMPFGLWAQMGLMNHVLDGDPAVLTDVVSYVSFGQGSSLLWTHTLRPFYSRPIALTQEGTGLVNDVANVCVTEG